MKLTLIYRSVKQVFFVIVGSRVNTPSHNESPRLEPLLTPPHTNHPRGGFDDLSV